MGGFHCFACGRVEDAQHVINADTFVSHLVLCSRFRHCSGRAILTVFQIQDAENDPLISTTALWCPLVSVRMSLSFGIVYIMRFDNMRNM